MPAVPSGRCSDLTEVERKKFIDLLFAKMENHRASLVGLENEIKRMGDELRRVNEASSRWEQRTLAAEKRVETAESDRVVLGDKIDRLLTIVGQLRNGDELKAMTARAEKAEKAVADLLASHRSFPKVVSR